MRYVESQRLRDASHTTSWCATVVNSPGSYLEFIRRREAQSRKRMNGGGGPRSRGGIDKIVSVRRLREKVRLSIRVKRPSGSGKTIRVRLGRRTQLSPLPAVRRARAAMRAVLYKAVLGVGGNARRSVSRTSRWLASCALRAAGSLVAYLGTAVRAGSRRVSYLSFKRGRRS